MRMLKLLVDNVISASSAATTDRRSRRFDDLELMGLTATDGDTVDVDGRICHLSLVRTSEPEDIIVEVRQSGAVDRTGRIVTVTAANAYDVAFELGHFTAIAHSRPCVTERLPR